MLRDNESNQWLYNYTSNPSAVSDGMGNPLWDTNMNHAKSKRSKKHSLRKAINRGVDRVGQFLGRHDPRVICMLAGAISAVGALLHADGVAAATKTWNSSQTGGFWNGSGNWSPSGIPQNGDTLTFNNCNVATTTDNIGPLTNIANITFNNSTTSYYVQADGTQQRSIGLANGAAITENYASGVAFMGQASGAASVNFTITGTVTINAACGRDGLGLGRQQRRWK